MPSTATSVAPNFILMVSAAVEKVMPLKTAGSWTGYIWCARPKQYSSSQPFGLPAFPGWRQLAAI